MEIMTRQPPEGWTLYRLGQLFAERREKVSDKDFQPLSVTMNGIVPQLESAAKTDDGDNRKLVRAGDYVINSRSDRKGSGGVSPLDGSVSLISIVLEPLRIHPPFAHHLLRSPAFQEEFYRWGHGIVADLWTTRYSDMKNIRLYLPDLATQKQIADFLDAETVRIDALIEKKLELIRAAERLRASSIDRAITGEDYDASRTDTGNIWFPTIHSGWRLARLKHLVNSISDGPHISPEYVDSGIPFMSARNIKVDRWSLDDAKFISEELFTELSRKSRPKKGDVLYTKGGTTGIARYVDLDFDFQIWVHVALLKVRRTVANAQFLATALNSLGCYEQSQLFTRGATNNDLGLNRMANIWVPLPPYEEQVKIVERLNQTFEKIDRLRSRLELSVGSGLVLRS